MQEQIDTLDVKLAQEVQQVDRRAAQAIDRPGCDHVDVAAGNGLERPIACHDPWRRIWRSRSSTRWCAAASYRSRLSSQQGAFDGPGRRSRAPLPPWEARYRMPTVYGAGAKHATKARQRGAVELPKGKAWGGLPITGVRPVHVLAVMNGLASTPGKARNFLAATKQLLGVGNHARPHRQQQFVLGPLRPGAREDPGVGWCNLHGLRCTVIRLRHAGYRCLRSAISWACLWRPCNATSASLTARKAAELLS
jgi:hypothetical protein